jgi:RHS repeat-associated protein
MFTGRRLDPETELYYFRMRMYCSAIGSFISRDPNGYVDGMSLYLGYFAPWGLDPLGLCKETFWGKLRESFRDFVWKSGDSFGKNLSRLTGRCLSEVRRAGVARG